MSKKSNETLPIDTSAIQLRLEKLLSLSNVLGSQQESADLIKDMDALIQKYSVDRLETVLAPSIVEIQKGRPKGTKRNKLGVEHEDEKISIEQKNAKKMKQETIKVEKQKKTKTTLSLRKPSTAVIKQIKSKYWSMLYF